VFEREFISVELKLTQAEHQVPGAVLWIELYETPKRACAFRKVSQVVMRGAEQPPSFCPGWTLSKRFSVERDRLVELVGITRLLRLRNYSRERPRGGRLLLRESVVQEQKRAKNNCNGLSRRQSRTMLRS